MRPSRAVLRTWKPQHSPERNSPVPLEALEAVVGFEALDVAVALAGADAALAGRDADAAFRLADTLVVTADRPVVAAGVSLAASSRACF